MRFNILGLTERSIWRAGRQGAAGHNRVAEFPKVMERNVFADRCAIWSKPATHQIGIYNTFGALNTEPK